MVEGLSRKDVGERLFPRIGGWVRRWDEWSSERGRSVGRPSRDRRSAIAVFIGRLIVTIVLLSIAAFSPVASNAAVTVGGPFVLSTPDGKVVTDRSFRGKWLLVYFGYTSCPESCPTALAEIAETLVKLGADAQSLQPIFITLDPRRDTRAVMGDYVKSFDPRILGLTGTSDQIDAVAHAYGAYAEVHAEPGQDGLIDHSVYIYLMNPSGSFVRAFDPSWSAERMASTLRAAMRSSPSANDETRSASERR